MTRTALRFLATPRGWVLLVLLFTLLAKLMLVHAAGTRYDLRSDDRSYVVTAQLWLETGTLTYNDPNRPTLFIMPAYPAMLAAVMAIMGPGQRMEQAVRALQALLVTGALWVLFLLGTRMFSPFASALGVTIAAFYPPLWLMSNFLLTEALFLAALAVLVLAGVRLGERGSTAAAALFGLAWVAAVMVRPTIALWPLGLFALLLLMRSMPLRQLLRCGAVTGLVFVLGMSPWWWRNYTVIGEFVPLARSSGSPLWLGTYPDGEPSLEDQVKFHAPYPTLLQQEAFDRAWALRRIKEGFRSEPLKWFQWYTVGKFTMYWALPFYWQPLPVIPYAIVDMYHRLLLVFGVAGLWVVRRNRPAWVVVSLLAYMSALHMVFLAHARYSAPMMPFVALLAGQVLAMLWKADVDVRELRASPSIEPR